MAALRQAAEAYEEIGNTWGRAWALQGTASAYNAMGDHKKALEYGLLTLAAWHDVNYTHGIANALRGKALAEWRAGRVDGVRESYRRALPILTALESPDIAAVKEQLAQLDAEQP